MQTEQMDFLERRYKARSWHGRTKHAGRVLKGISLEDFAPAGWTLSRKTVDERAKTKAVRSLWARGASSGELLAVDLFECASAKAAHDQVLEALANMQSSEIEMRTGAGAPGDVAFSLGSTLSLFAIANLVVLVRNAGSSVVSVEKVARDLETVAVKHLKRRPGRE